mgnify:FL=1
MCNRDEKVVPLFSKTVVITGKHAQYMKALANPFDTNLKQGFFKRNLDVYLIAPIIGKLYGRKAEADNSIADDTKIFVEQLNGEIENLMFNYRLIVLLEDRNDEELEERCNRAFRYDKNMDKRQYGDKIFNEYVLGGIEFLYEKLIGESTSTDELIENAYTLIDSFNDDFKESFSFDEIEKLSILSSV